MIITVTVNSHSRFEKVEKIDEKNYRVSFNVKPERGKANKRVIELLADYFSVSKSQISILLGKTAKEKVIEIEFLKKINLYFL